MGSSGYIFTTTVYECLTTSDAVVSCDWAISICWSMCRGNGQNKWMDYLNFHMLKD